MGIKHIARMAEYLKRKGWSDSEVVSMILFIGKEDPVQGTAREGEEVQRIWRHTQEVNPHHNQPKAEEKRYREEIREPEHSGMSQTLTGRYAGISEPEPEEVSEEKDGVEEKLNGPDNDGYDPEEDREPEEEEIDDELDEDDVDEGDIEEIEEDIEEPDEDDLEEPDDEPEEEPEDDFDDEPAGSPKGRVNRRKHSFYDEEPDLEEPEPEPDDDDLSDDEPSPDEPEEDEPEEDHGTGESVTEEVNEPKELKKAKYRNMPFVLERSEFTFSYITVEIRGGNGKVAKAQIITTPLDIDDDRSRLLGCCAITGNKKADIAISQEGEQVLNFIIGGYPVTVSGSVDGGKYSSVCSIPEHYIREGTVMNQKESTYGRDGHVIIHDPGIDTYVHILPLSFKNGKDGQASILYCIERGDADAEIGIKTKGGATFMADGKLMNITSKWGDDGRLYTQIK